MKEVAKTSGTAVATRETPAHSEGVLNSDIMIPRLLLMQGLSDFVNERKAQQGDMVRSTTIQKLGDIETPVNIIPLKLSTSWREAEKIGQKFEYRKTFARTVANEQLPWTFHRNPQGQEFDKPGALGATEWQRTKSIELFALLPSDIIAFQKEMAAIAKSGEIPDLTKTVLPVNISFRVTSFSAGRAVATFFAQVQEMAQYSPGLKHYSYVLPLAAKPEKNDKGSYFIFDIGKPAKADPATFATAERWYNTLNSLSTIKVDETGEEVAAPREGGAF